MLGTTGPYLCYQHSLNWNCCGFESGRGRSVGRSGSCSSWQGWSKVDGFSLPPPERIHIPNPKYLLAPFTVKEIPTTRPRIPNQPSHVAPYGQSLTNLPRQIAAKHALRPLILLIELPPSVLQWWPLSPWLFTIGLCHFPLALFDHVPATRRRFTHFP